MRRPIAGLCGLKGRAVIARGKDRRSRVVAPGKRSRDNTCALKGHAEHCDCSARPFRAAAPWDTIPGATAVPMNRDGLAPGYDRAAIQAAQPGNGPPHTNIVRDYRIFDYSVKRKDPAARSFCLRRNPISKIQKCSYSASAPPMISIISVVIVLCLARL
jgi:hypothetical protein